MMTVEVCKGCVSPKACAIIRKCKQTHKTLKARYSGTAYSNSYDEDTIRIVTEEPVQSFQPLADTRDECRHDAGSTYDSSSSCDNGTTDWD